MVQTKKMNESSFAQLLKNFNVVGELIRARQDEKQGLLNEFDSECKRFFFGKISEKALASSVRKTNSEISRLDAEIRKNITEAKRVSGRATNLCSAQAPRRFRATLSGITGEGAKKPMKKKVVKKKPVKRKPVKKQAPKKKKVVKKKTSRKK
jgi:hypothetical protein